MSAQPQASSVARRVVVALGGNAITRPGGDDSVGQDLANLDRSLGHVVDLIQSGYQVILTHGNGPQVGNQMIRNELARGQAPDLPLDLVVADLQGGLGYMIELVLRNKLHHRGMPVPVCALLTLVEVDPDDPAMREPTKFVGPAYGAAEVDKLSSERGWKLKEDRGRGFRRVVASPRPRSIVEVDSIAALVERGVLVIVTGGGGIPVARTADGFLRGVEAVIDKDFASAVLARELGAEELFILTGVEKVALGYGTPEQRWLDRLTAAEARRFLAAGHFPAGSMGPKIEAACQFVENGGKSALITDIFTIGEAIQGKTGTRVVP
jgi:carbamate kinase